MKYTFVIVLVFLFFSNESYSQKKISSSQIKGYWMIKNESNEFYNSDTLIFFKRRNPDKSIPLHHWKRPFLESEHLLKKDIPRVNLDLNFMRRAICSEVSFDESGSGHSIEHHWGKWKLNKNQLEIKSEYHYIWRFRIKKVEKIKFNYNGKTYKTLKMTVIKTKFENTP